MLNAIHVIRGYLHGILECIIKRRMHDWHKKLQWRIRPTFLLVVRIKKFNKMIIQYNLVLKYRSFHKFCFIDEIKIIKLHECQKIIEN